MEKILYLVTGACGHVGSQIVKLLARKGLYVRGLKLKGEDDSLIAGEKIEIILGDVREKESLRGFFEIPQGMMAVVFHAAGIVSIAAKVNENIRNVNVEGTRNIVALCREAGVKRLVYVSSVHAIPERPRGEVVREVDRFSPDAVTGAYAKTKAEATQIVLDAVRQGLDAVVVHPSGILGPGDSGHNHANQIIREYLCGRLPIIVRGGYDWVDVRDVAQGCLLAQEKGITGECYILSGGYCDICTITDLLSKITGSKRHPIVLPLWLVSAFAPFAEWIDHMQRQTPMFTQYSLYTLHTNSCFSCDKARRELGYAPRPMAETLQDMVSSLCGGGKPAKGTTLRRRKTASNPR